MKKYILFLAAGLLAAENVMAHCPLCTLGAAAAAGGAKLLGVNNSVLGIFLGAFAVSTGWWVGRIIKKQLIPFQMQLIVLFSFIATIIPLKPLLENIRPLYLPSIGAYGLTLPIDLYLAGSLIGGFIAAAAPWASKKIGDLRGGKMIPYQGIVLTFILLLAAGTITQLMF